MDWESIAKLGEFVLVVAQLLFVVFMFVMKGTFATKKDMAGALEIGADAQHRIDIVEERMKNMPTHDTVQDLGAIVTKIDRHLAESVVKMEGLGEKVDDVRESVRTLDAIVRRLP